MRSKAGFVRLLWRLLVVAVVVYVVGGIVALFFDDPSPFGSGDTFRDIVFDAQFIAFRVGAGSLALMAGLWLSSRPWDES